MKKNNFLKTSMTIIITAFITFSVTYLWFYGKKEEKVSSENIISNAFSSDAFSSDSFTTKLKTIKQKIDEDFMGTVDEEKLKEYAIKGYIVGLGDKYSQYYTAEEMKDFNTDTNGSFVGIGVYITRDVEKNEVVIYNTMKNSPAEEAGIKAGDIIKSVDGEACNGDDFDTISDKIRGKSGTKVTIELLRDDETITLEIKRRAVEIQKVSSQIINDNIGYIYIENFDGNVAKQFKEEYEKLISEGIKSLIVDIRNNGGGLVDEVLDIADMFTNKGETLLIESDNKENEIKHESKEEKEINMNVVLLTNEYSASASEILAGILKENVENATVVGNTTYGKGVIQSVYQLTDGSGLKITTNEYFTPSHQKINNIGIEPDVKIDDYSFDGILDEENDTQLKKAIDVLRKKKN